jgi:outer membrane protein TolC
MTRPNSRTNTTLLMLTFALAAGGGTACRSPQQFRHEADRAAADIIEQKQQEALGRTEAFEIDRPADLLRHRLFVEQDLQYGSVASLGPQYLPSIRYFPEHIPTGTPIPAPGGEVDAEAVEPPPPLRLTLVDALQVGARNSRAYQTRKENVFIEALRLDLERNFFRTTLTGIVSGQLVTNLGPPRDTTGVVVSPQVGFTQRFQNGVTLGGRVAIDIVKLLTGDRSSSLGILADTTVSMPLLRGSGRHIVAEPLTQAERGVIYALWDFENYKRNYALDVARDYLSVLQSSQQVANAEENYRRLITSTRRALRLSEAGRLDNVQVDQAIQQELRARERWISSRETFFRRLDSFKILIGLPPDAHIELDETELERLASVSERILTDTTDQPVEPVEPVPPADAPVILIPPGLGTPGPLELYAEDAIELALEHRLDLRIAEGQIYDAQRRVVVAADALGAGLNLAGTASWGARRSSIGSANLPDAQLRFDEGLYSLSSTLDLPLERTAERNAYRTSLINLERAVRTYQESEDSIKLAVRTTLGSLLQARESLHIQARALVVAERRVASTELFLEAGRALMRDVLEAQEALITAQNAFTAALINYRINELALQRDLGVLEVTNQGLWLEYTPESLPEMPAEEQL